MTQIELPAPDAEVLARLGREPRPVVRQPALAGVALRKCLAALRTVSLVVTLPALAVTAGPAVMEQAGALVASGRELATQVTSAVASCLTDCLLQLIDLPLQVLNAPPA